MSPRDSEFKQVLRGLLTMIAILIAIPMLFAAGVFVLIAGEDVYNKLTLLQMEDRLQALPHPEGSLLLRSTSEIWDTGGSQCCISLFTAELRQYPGDKEDLVDFYADYGVSLHFVENGGYVNPYNDLNLIPFTNGGYRKPLDEQWQVSFDEIDGVVYMLFFSQLGRQTIQ